ncbi:LamG domain-containing protein [bacterium]|nr:LamG domain-containing protein [bacterium]
MAIPTKWLRCLLDARNTNSYPGTGTTWTDLSGNGNNFTLSNTTYNAGGWLSFNGTTSGAIGNPTTPNNFTVDNHSTTVSMLVRPTSNQGSASKPIITDNFGPEFGIWYNGTNYIAYCYSSASATKAFNEWAHITMVIPYVARNPAQQTVTGGSHTSGTTTLLLNNASGTFTYSASGQSNDRVTVTSSNPTGYNGTYALTAANTTSISYAQGSDPGTWVSGSLAKTKVGNTKTEIYLNGEFVTSGTATVGNGANDWPLTIGYDDRSGAPIDYFTGDIAWVGIWQTALNQVDIRNIYLALKGRM